MKPQMNMSFKRFSYYILKDKNDYIWSYKNQWFIHSRSQGTMESRLQTWMNWDILDNCITTISVFQSKLVSERSSPYPYEYIVLHKIHGFYNILILINAFACHILCTWCIVDWWYTFAGHKTSDTSHNTFFFEQAITTDNKNVFFSSKNTF